jgi:2-keto-3-deoxy-L-rhamnonate aldolase RhmA/quercetin dioxygenase-like cupin family protein
MLTWKQFLYNYFYNKNISKVYYKTIMKKTALLNLKNKLSNHENIYGLWVTLESGSITEMAVALGLDFVVVDVEHGHLDWGNVLDHIRASVRSDTVLLVRIAELQEGLIKRVLDIGADGIIIPHIETVEKLNQALSYARYPPNGVRGIGAERATCWGQSFVEHVNEANDILVIPLIESIKAEKNIKDLVQIEGTDIFFFGPADFAASAGYTGQWDVPVVNDHINLAKEIVIESGKVCGIVAASNEEIEKRAQQGFNMFAIGFDSGLIINGIRQILKGLGRDRNITCDLGLNNLLATGNRIGPLPAGYQPDRKEKVYQIGEGKIIELSSGIICETLVGEYTEAINLSTAIVTFEAGHTTLNAHTHPHSESITLLSGHALVEVADRRYMLNPLDNITIPKNCVHSIKNLSIKNPAVFHIAMPTTAVERTWVRNESTIFNDIPEEFNGHMGPERITRYKTARRYAAGLHTEFIDYFNDILMPGIGMSGGYGLFYQGGRLPAHMHDFDESICIIDGEATCFVEGRQYKMANLATAMQPRGRIHYFINKSDKAMSMVWVYGGPTPERIEVPDEYATVGTFRK